MLYTNPKSHDQVRTIRRSGIAAASLAGVLVLAGCADLAINSGRQSVVNSVNPIDTQETPFAPYMDGADMILTSANAAETQHMAIDARCVGQTLQATWSSADAITVSIENMQNSPVCSTGQLVLSEAPQVASLLR